MVPGQTIPPWVREVAVTTDGLIVRLPGFDDGLIPWHQISGAAVKDLPSVKRPVAQLAMKDRPTTAIGGLAKVFPTRDDAERFVRQVTDRVHEAKC